MPAIVEKPPQRPPARQALKTLRPARVVRAHPRQPRVTDEVAYEILFFRHRDAPVVEVVLEAVITRNEPE